MSAEEKSGSLEDLKAKAMRESKAEKVKGGAGPIDSKLPAGPIDGVKKL